MEVIKIGGAAGVDTRALCADLARLVAAGYRLVVVHGGSDEATRLGEQLGVPPRFLVSPSGQTSRYTDERTLEVFQMATALVNRRLVAELAALGVSALGLSGLDGALFTAERKTAVRSVEDGRVRIVRDDRSGRPTQVNTTLLNSLLDAGYVPVIAPVGLDPEGGALNVDGDRLAALIASELGARQLALMTAVPGLLTDLEDAQSVVPHIDADEAGLDYAMGLAQGRMRKKVLAAREALAAGVPEVVIAGTAGDAPVARALQGHGTRFGSRPLERVR